MAKVERSYEEVRDLMVKERFLATCHKPLELFSREKAVTELVELGKLAEQYEDVHGTKPNAKRENESSSSKKPADEIMQVHDQVTSTSSEHRKLCDPI